MIKIIEGEKRNISKVVSNKDNQSFTINNITCQVTNDNYELIEDNLLTYIEDKKVTCIFDSNQDFYEIGKIYYIYFTIEIKNLNRIIKDVTEIQIVRKR